MMAVGVLKWHQLTSQEPILVAMETAQVVMAPPLEVGVAVVMAVPLAKNAPGERRWCDIVDRDAHRCRGASAGVATRDGVAIEEETPLASC